MSKPENSFLILVTGEAFLRKKKIEELLPEISPNFNRATDLFRVYPDELNWNDLISQAKTPSLLGGAQIYWISDAQRIKGNDWSLLETYLQQPVPNSFFIFEADELSLSHPLVKLVQRYGRHSHHEPRRGESGAEHLKEKLRRFNKIMTPGAWQALFDRCGGSLTLMDNCLDQVISYEEANTIDEEAIEKLSANFLRYDVFDLTEAIMKKDTFEAIRIFHFFYDLNGDITSTVGLLHWQLKRIWQAKQMLKLGASNQDIAKTLRISA